MILISIDFKQPAKTTNKKRKKLENIGVETKVSQKREKNKGE